MSDQSLGRNLRAAIEQQRHEPSGQVDPRRLENGLAARVTPDQQALLPALSYLLRSPLVAKLLSQPAELTGTRRETLVTALRQELHALYTPALCNRLEAVLVGLLGLQSAPAPAPGPAQVPAAAAAPVQAAAPAQAAAAAVTAAAAAALDSLSAPAAAPAPAPAPAATRVRGAGPGPLVAVLSFLVGILGGALVLLWLQRQPQLPPRDADNGTPQGRLAPPAPALPGDNSTRGITEGSAADSTEASTEGSAADSAADGEGRNEPADASSEPATAFTTGNATGAATATATATVERLYAALNARDTEAARRLFAAAAADQFDPAFFNQFSRVAVTQLRPTATNGSQVMLEGLVTFTYPDGTRQIETRSFRVDTATDPAQIVASGFGQVIQAR